MSRVGTRPVTREAGTRQSSKAQYHAAQAPINTLTFANVAGVVNRLHQKRAAARRALSQRPADNQEPADTVARDGYSIPSDLDLAAAIMSRSAYLREMQIEADFLAAMRVLLSQPDLPYNPYPNLMHQMLAHSENSVTIADLLVGRIHMFTLNKEAILSSISHRVQRSDVPYVFHPVGYVGLCGLKSLMKVVDPNTSHLYTWMLRSLTPPAFTIESDDDYSVQVITALVGESVFRGTFYQRPLLVKTRVEFLISGQSVNEAIPLFVNSVIKDIFHMERGSHHIIFGIWLPGGPTQQDGAAVVAKDAWWTLDDIQDGKDEFWSALYRTTLASRLIHVKGYFRTDEHLTLYQPGEKQYGLTVIEMDPTTGQEVGLTSFTEFPLLTAHEGAFLKKTDMEAYLAAFAPQMATDDRTMDSTPAPCDGSCDNLAERWPSKIRIHGFKYGPDTGYSPYAWQVTAPIRTSLQRMIASSQPAADLMNVMYGILLLVLIDRKVYSVDVLVELCEILRSTAAKLSYVQTLNECLQSLILHAEQGDESELVTGLYIRYKQEVEDLLTDEQHECSSVLQTVGHIIIRNLKDIVETDSEFSQTVPSTEKTIKCLRHIHSYCRTVFLLLAEASLTNAPAVQKVIETVKETYPELAVKPGTQVQATKDRAKGALHTGNYIATDFRHGHEDTEMIKHDLMVLNRAACIERDSAPDIISVDSVLMKYVVDTRLDEMWQNYLADILSGPYRPANPHARLVTTLCGAAMRMDLGYLSDLRILEKVVHKAARVEDVDNFVYHVPGCDVHGLSSALSLLDVSSFNKIIPLVQEFISKDFIQRRGPYRVAICCAVSGAAPLYGAMMPYLLSIELHEHCYIRGPDRGNSEAIQLYARIVYEHLHQLESQAVHPISGVVFGEDESQLSVSDIIQHKDAFMSEMEKYCIRKEQILIKAYIQHEWRYVPVSKCLHFHFVNDAETGFECYFLPDIPSLYQNVFLDRDKAAFHFQYGGPPHQSDPFSASNTRAATRHIDSQIMVAELRADWLTIYRWLLTRNLIHQGTSQIAEVWRMLHSVAAQIEYVNTLRETLQELVQLILTLRENGDTSNVSAVSMRDKDMATVTGSVSLPVLDKMAAGFREKLLSVCCQQVALGARCLPDVMTTKLADVIIRNDVSKQLTIRITAQTVSVLSEIGSMLRCLQDTASCDIHHGCPIVQAVLTSLRAEQRQSARLSRAESSDSSSTVPHKSLPSDISLPQMAHR